jgi:hypothetical protein
VLEYLMLMTQEGAMITATNEKTSSSPNADETLEAEVLRIIKEETDVHARLHQSTDFRASIGPLGLVAMLGAFIALIVFAKQDIPLFVTIGIVTTGILSVVTTIISLYASSRNLHKGKTEQQVVEEAFELARNSEKLISKAAAQLAAMATITPRKCWSFNATLFLLGCGLIFLLLGLLFVML